MTRLILLFILAFIALMFAFTVLTGVLRRLFGVQPPTARKLHDKPKNKS
jgi:hypothetical protein